MFILISAYKANLAIQSVEHDAIARVAPAVAPSPAKAVSTPEGLHDQGYEIDNHYVGFGDFQAPIQVGFWRSVNHSQNGFFNESFIDECAHATGKDPVQFRLDMLHNDQRQSAVLKKVAQMSHWGSSGDPNVFQGVSLNHSFHSTVAEVAEIRKICLLYTSPSPRDS